MTHVVCVSCGVSCEKQYEEQSACSGAPFIAKMHNPTADIFNFLMIMIRLVMYPIVIYIVPSLLRISCFFDFIHDDG